MRALQNGLFDRRNTAAAAAAAVGAAAAATVAIAAVFVGNAQSHHICKPQLHCSFRRPEAQALGIISSVECEGDEGAS